MLTMFPRLCADRSMPEMRSALFFLFRQGGAGPRHRRRGSETRIDGGRRERRPPAFDRKSAWMEINNARPDCRAAILDPIGKPRRRPSSVRVITHAIAPEPLQFSRGADARPRAPPPPSLSSPLAGVGGRKIARRHDRDR